LGIAATQKSSSFSKIGGKRIEDEDENEEEREDWDCI